MSHVTQTSPHLWLVGPHGWVCVVGAHGWADAAQPYGACSSALPYAVAAIERAEVESGLSIVDVAAAVGIDL